MLIQSGCFLCLIFLAKDVICLFSDGPSHSETIPKIIHYVWVGGKEKTPLAKSNVNTWKEICKGWTIVEWNDESIAQMPFPFIHEALAVRKYAFVADFLRVYAVAKYGGVYMDTDVELLKPLEPLLHHRFFIGVEKQKGGPYCLGAHMFGAVANHTILTDLYLKYSSMHFINEDGRLNQRIIPLRFVDIMRKRYVFPNLTKIDKPYELADKAMIYPVWYFCNQRIKGQTYAVHHFVGSWVMNLHQVDPSVLKSVSVPESNNQRSDKYTVVQKGETGSDCVLISHYQILLCAVLLLLSCSFVGLRKMNYRIGKKQ